MILYSFNGHAINDKTNYEAIIPADSPLMAQTKSSYTLRSAAWPVFAKKDLAETRFPILVAIRGGSGSLAELKMWFDTMILEPVKLVATDDGKNWAMMVNPESITMVGTSAVRIVLSTSDLTWVDDGAGNSETWNITASGQTKVITVDSERYVEPTLEISSVSGLGYIYQRYVRLYNKIEKAFLEYPLELTGGGWNTAALVAAGKMQADGDDLRVFIGGMEVNRWLGSMNSAATKVWVTIDLKLGAILPLLTTIASSGAISSIFVTNYTPAIKAANKKKLQRLPKSGFVMIDSEVFAYTGINVSKLAFTGITRAVNGSSMAGHSANASICWVEHDVRIVYGDVDATALVIDGDSSKPIIDLVNSTNSSWVYTIFGEYDVWRAGAWFRTVDLSAGNASLLRTGDLGTDVTPFEAMGMEIDTYYSNGLLKAGQGKLLWTLVMPGGISTISSNGSKYRGGATFPKIAGLKKYVNGIWTSLWNESSPVSLATWTSWTHNSISVGNGTTVAFIFEGAISKDSVRANFEVQGATVALTATGVPSISLGGEILQEWNDLTIENITSGDVVQVVFPFMTDTLVVDCQERTAVSGYINKFGTLRLSYSAYWLRLLPGDNTLMISGRLGEINVDVCWKDKKL